MRHTDKDIEPTGAEPELDTAGASATQDKKWWQADGLPWSKEPTKRDLLCWGLFFVIGVYGIATKIAQPMILAADPLWSILVNGSRTALVAIGAQHAETGYPYWWAVILLATVSLIKFDPVFWYAGRLWGQGIINLIGGKSDRARRRTQRVQDFTVKYAPVVIMVTQSPLPFPDGVVAAVLGSGKMSLRRYLAYDFVFGLIMRSIYFYLGYRYHEQALAIVKIVERYSFYLSMAILASVIVGYLVNSRRAKAQTAAAAPRDES